MIIIADSNIFMSALISPQGLIASVLAERKKIHFFTSTEELSQHLYKK